MQFAAVGIAAAFLPACRNDKPVVLAQGGLFPDIELPALDGHIAPSVARNIPLVINFWATWCEPCRREMPSLEKLSTLFFPKDLLVIGISVDSDRNLAHEFSLRYKLAIPMLSDSDQALSNGILRIPAFPVTYLLRRDRTIARIFVGARDWADPVMVDEIEKLLAVRRKGHNQ
ncbi:MAG: TlpA family protein disulfide reductase [Betaproteobacteria bacterium]|nr:TlpA family protein disulfide reductase [Betaproteobacteria bacterium]